MEVSERIRVLNETRMNVWEEAKAWIERLGSQEMNAEERETWARYNQRIDDLEAEVTGLAKRAEREKETAVIRETENRTFGEKRVLARQQTEAEMLRAFALGEIRGNAASYDGGRGIEIPVVQAFKEQQLIRQGAGPDEVRLIAWDATSGSLVVPTTMARSLANVLQANIAAFRIGATQLVTDSGENWQLPVLKTHAIGTQTSGMGTTLAGTESVFNRVALNVYKYNQLTQTANEMLTDSAFDIAGFIGEDQGYALARVIDADLVVGTGSGEPTGMTVLAGAGTNAPVTTGGSLIAPTIEVWINALYSVNDAARNTSAAAWLMADSVAGTVRKLRDGAGGTVGAFLWEASLFNGVAGAAPGRFLGLPVFNDTNCAAAGSNATLATVGDFGQYIIRMVGNPVLERSLDAGFTTDTTYFRGKWRVGGNHRQVSHLNNLVQNV